MNFGLGRFQKLESHKRIRGVALKDEAYKENKERYVFQTDESYSFVILTEIYFCPSFFTNDGCNLK